MFTAGPQKQKLKVATDPLFRSQKLKRWDHKIKTNKLNWVVKPELQKLNLSAMPIIKNGPDGARIHKLLDF